MTREDGLWASFRPEAVHVSIGMCYALVVPGLQILESSFLILFLKLGIYSILDVVPDMSGNG